MSFPATDPYRVAKVLAELTQGRYFEFPITPGAWMTIVGDAHGSAIEILPRDQAWLPGEREVETGPIDRPAPLTAFHVALSVPVSRETVEEVGLREGWLVRFCDRGPFELIELWVENSLMIEVLTPETMGRYLEFVQPESYGAWLDGVKAPLAVPAG
jgi:hypothetical protein